MLPLVQSVAFPVIFVVSGMHWADVLSGNGGGHPETMCRIFLRFVWWGRARYRNTRREANNALLRHLPMPRCVYKVPKALWYPLSQYVWHNVLLAQSYRQHPYWLFWLLRQRPALNRKIAHNLHVPDHKDIPQSLYFSPFQGVRPWRKPDFLNPLPNRHHAIADR